MGQNKISKVVIIGGGPTGLVAAILIKKIVNEVIVLEKKTYPINKVCGEGLMPRAVQFLKEQKILDESFFADKNNFYPFRGINFSYHDTYLRGEFPPSKDGLGIKRSVLSMTLFKKAQNLGVEIQTGKVADSISDREHDCVIKIKDSDQTLCADLVIMCDGLHSVLQKKCGIEKISLYPSILKKRGEFPRRLGAREHYQTKPWSNKVEVYWAQGIEAYVTPLGENSVGVAWLYDAKRFKPGSGTKSYLEAFPELESKLSGAQSLNDFAIFGPLGFKSNKGNFGRVCLLGDSFAFYDGITGEGLASSFSECQLFFSKLSQYQLGTFKSLKDFFNAFELEREEILATTCNHCSFTLFLSGTTLIKRAVFRFLNEFPAFFNKILAIQVAGKKLTLKNFF